MRGGACIPHEPDAALSGPASPARGVLPAHGAGASVAANRLMTRPEGDREAVPPAREGAREGQARSRSAVQRVDDVVNVGNIVIELGKLVRCMLKSLFGC